MEIIIFGNRDAASLAHFYISNDTEHYVSAFCMDSAYIKEANFENKPVIAFEDLDYHLGTYFDKNSLLFMPIYENELRAKKYQEAKNKGFKFLTYISSKATCWSTDIGENCFIMEDNTIQPYSKIGNNTILWSGNHIGHHSIIEDHVFVSSHVVMSGHVKVESFSWLGVNSCIRDAVTIRRGTIVGMGAVVIKNTEENSTVVGSPAKRIK